MTYRDEHDIEAILKPLQSAKPADPGAILRAKNIVMAQVQRTTKYEFDTNIRKVPLLVMMRRVKFAPALAVVLIVLLGGGGVAAAAQGALPGDVLYAVKIATERVAVKLAPTARVKVRVETKLAERRVQELKVLQERAVQAPPEVKVELQKNIEILKERLEEIEMRNLSPPSSPARGEEGSAALYVPLSGGQAPALQKGEGEGQDNAKALEFPPQAATIPILDDETRQFVENAEELFIGLRTQKAELKQKGLDLDGGVDATIQELQALITKARALWNDRKFNDVRALEPQIQTLLVRIAHLLDQPPMEMVE